MKRLYADFNDITATGFLHLTCRGSVASIAMLDEALANGEEVWLADNELRVKARVFLLGDGSWEARSDWVNMPFSTSFEFNDEAITCSGDRHVAIVPRNISTTHALLGALAERLGLPAYFGFNWNALSDCLRDLHWLEEREVVIAHHDVPAIPPFDLRMYLDVLGEAVADWRSGDGHKLRVVFATQDRERIDAAGLYDCNSKA